LFGRHGERDHADHLQDLAAFPVKDVRDALVDAFFDKINPYFPVIDEFDFRRQYESTATSPTADMSNSDPPPLILMQAVLLAGAHVCDHPRVSQSRAIVKAALFSRARALFNMRHENNRLHLIQAALLFTWYLEDADTASANSYYWAGVACRIAFGIGMHRNLSPCVEACMMPIAERRIYRRVWWTLFQTEIFTALEHGRPSMISLDEIDQPPLERDDFIEENGLLNSKLNFAYCQGNIELSYITLELLRLNSPGVVACQGDLDLHHTRTSLDSRLINWVLKNPAGDDLQSLQLQMHYQTVLLLLHRGFNRMGTTRNSSQLQHQKQSQSSDICNRAVHALIAIFETMLSKGFLAQCPFTAIIAVTAAAAHLSLEIRIATETGATLLALNTQNHLRRLFRPISELSQHWPHAEAVLVLFQSMDEGFRNCLAGGGRDGHPRYFPDQGM
jgi:transcriptional regulatory protein AMDR